MLALVFAAATLIAQATDAVATPTPPPLVYDDAAMHFRAPDGWILVARRYLSPSQLSDDPAPAAGWIYPNKDHPRRMVITFTQFDSHSVSDFETTYEDTLRQQLDTPFFKDKEHIALGNGMPAMFVVVNSGTGFSMQKQYLLEWVDGVRGVVVSITAGYADLTEQQAKALLLTDVTAVAYPVGEP